MSSEAATQEKPFQLADRAGERLSVGKTRGLGSVLNLDDFQQRAKVVLPQAIYGYVENGSKDEISLRTNRAVSRNYRLVPRMLQNVKRRSQSVSMFGRTYATPFGIAPMGWAVAVTCDGDLMMARAVAKSGVPFTLSGNSLVPMEEVAVAHPAPGSRPISRRTPRRSRGW